MNKETDIHIVAIVEKGYLEHQLRLLILSIEEFVKPKHSVKIVACSPRKGLSPDQSYINFLNQYNVDFIDEPLNIKHDFFPLCNNIYACDYVSKNYQNINTMILVDTDTLFLNPVSDSILNIGDMHLRPVDNKGIGSLGEGDANNNFWSDAFNHLNVVPTHNKILTTVSQELIRPYYNSGFVLVNKGVGFMQQWKKDFIRLMESNIRTSPSQSRHQVDYGFIEQMVTSITIEKINAQVELLPETYNYPIPFRPKIKDRVNHPKFNELVHIHYHKWFQHPGFLDHITNSEDKETVQYKWLKEHLPLMPEIYGDFKC